MYKLLMPFLLLSSVLRANEIDQIRTMNDVERFMRRHIDGSFRSKDALVHQFFKVDLDDNGLTDLVIAGNRLLVVMDLGGGEYSETELRTGSYPFYDSAMITGIDSSSQPKKLLVRLRDGQSVILDTVVCHAGEMMEYNPHPDSAIDFDELRGSATGCYGKCPQFDLTIKGDGQVVYHPHAFTREKVDVTAQLTKGEMDTLRSILGYMGIDRMAAGYSEDVMDTPGFVFEIHYHGRIKRIVDGDVPSTNSLAVLFRALMTIQNKMDR